MAKLEKDEMWLRRLVRHETISVEIHEPGASMINRLQKGGDDEIIFTSRNIGFFD